MSYTYATKKQRPAAPAPAVAEETTSAATLDALRAGAIQPTAEQLGHQVDLPGAIRAKMESAFGADLSAVKLYESQTVADAGARAVAQGNHIAFAPGMLDFASTSGQALLGHELSHVVSQARGEVTGSGLLSDAGLEARADREGAMAAAGESVYTGPVTTALSTASAAPAAAPMQASKGWVERFRARRTEKQAQNMTDSLLRKGAADQVDALAKLSFGADFDATREDENEKSVLDAADTKMLDNSTAALSTDEDFLNELFEQTYNLRNDAKQYHDDLNSEKETDYAATAELFADGQAAMLKDKSHAPELSGIVDLSDDETELLDFENWKERVHSGYQDRNRLAQQAKDAENRSGEGNSSGIGAMPILSLAKRMGVFDFCFSEVGRKFQEYLKAHHSEDDPHPVEVYGWLEELHDGLKLKKLNDMREPDLLPDDNEFFMAGMDQKDRDQHNLHRPESDNVYVQAKYLDQVHRRKSRQQTLDRYHRREAHKYNEVRQKEKDWLKGQKSSWRRK